MWGQSLFKTNSLSYGTVLSLGLFLSACSAHGGPLDFSNQEQIVEAYLSSTPESRAQAQLLSKQAEKTASKQKEKGKENYGPLVKLWCEAVLISPSVNNLAECASARYNAVNSMSNPQPSREEARINRAKESLVITRAALEIAGGQPEVKESMRARLVSQAKCLREVISRNSENNYCP